MVQEIPQGAGPGRVTAVYHTSNPYLMVLLIMMCITTSVWDTFMNTHFLSRRAPLFLQDSSGWTPYLCGGDCYKLLP